MCPSWPKEHDWKSCKSLTRLLGFESPHLRHRRHGLHIVRDDFFISKKSSAHSFRRSSSPQKAYAFRGPDICFCCKERDSNRAIRRIETVRWTVSVPAGVPKKALAFNGRIPTSAPSSSQASYRLWRLSFYPFIESHPALITLLLLSPKSLRFSGTPIFVFVVKIGIRTGQFEE